MIVCKGCGKLRMPMIKIELISNDAHDGVFMHFCVYCIMSGLDLVKEACIEGMNLKRYV